MQPLILLVYTSQSRQPVDGEMIDAILNVAQTFNSQNNITGFLMVRGNYFLQLLEGPEDAVLQLYNKISMDKRHHRITLQGKASIENRIMDKWSMGYIEEFKETQPSAQSMLELFELAREGQVISSAKPLEKMLRIFSRDAKIR